MAGQPTKYKSEYAKQAHKLCLLGSTDADLADFFEVPESTINNWKKAQPEFLESIKKGKQLADGNVADRLYKRALGYKHRDVDIKMFEGQIIQTPLVKYYPPDTTACIFWLKNRQRDKWRDKQDVEVSGNNKQTVVHVYETIDTKTALPNSEEDIDDSRPNKGSKV